MKPKLLILPKSEGKTAQLARWVKEKNGLMICHNTTAAIKTNKKYGVNTVYPEEFIRKFHGYSPYIDRVGIDNFELYERPFILLLNHVLQSAKEVAVTIGDIFEVVEELK